VLHLSPRGDALAFAACLCWAVYSLLMIRANERYDSVFITRKVFFYGLVTIIPYYILVPGLPPLDVLMRPQVLGNLLENAVEACQRQTAGERRIQVRGQTTQSTLAVTIDNTYETAPEKDRRGRFRSMKHSGPGIGTESVKNIVARYNGVINFETKGDLFCVSVMLYLH
jgi:nitrogen fixation/metabolism regulation signal transduction histidine kinase